MEIDGRKLGLDSWDSDSDEIDEDVVLAGRKKVLPADGKEFDDNGSGLAKMFGSFFERVFPAQAVASGSGDAPALEDENYAEGSGSGTFKSALDSVPGQAMEFQARDSNTGGGEVDNDDNDDDDDLGNTVADSDVEPIVN